MGTWRSVLGYLTGASVRQKGIQGGIPATSVTPPAINVTTDIALQLSAVWACARLISEAIGSMPIKVWNVNRETGERTQNFDHPLAVLFSNQVNRWQTRQEYFESSALQLVLHGNTYSAIQRDTKGKVIGLVPLMSEQMQVELLDNGDLLYKYTEQGGVRAYAEQTIWHNKLFGNGVIGLSPLAYAKNSVAIGAAAEQSVSKIYRNGGKPSGILTLDKVLTAEQRAAIKDKFSELAEGNNDRLFVLEAGFDYKQVSLSPQDIELLASRRFQIEDIARFFGVPSVLINDTASGTTWGSGVQQIVQGFYKLNLRPYLERLEASMRARLLTPVERQTIDIEFDFTDFLRPEQSERLKASKEAVQGGLMTPNEARAIEGWSAKDGGDSLLVQQQMIQLEKIDTVNRGAANGQEMQNKV